MNPTLLRILLLVTGSHLVLWMLGIWSVEIIQDDNISSLRHSLNIWNRWDTPHYLDLARHGYSNHGELGLFIVFFPAFPAILKCLSWLYNDAFAWSLLLSFFCLIASCLALHRIACHYRDEATADRVIWYLLIFPTSYFFRLGYTEALFMASLLWLWVAMLERRWLLVGGLGMLLCATRINGALIGLVLGFEMACMLWQTRHFDWRWLYTALIPCGLLLYLGINYWVYQDPFYFLQVQQNHWHKSPGTPLTALADLWNRLSWDKNKFWTMGVFELAAVALGLVATVYGFFRVSFSSGLWSASNMLLMTSTGWALSLPRYILVIFPIYFLLADLSRNPQIKNLLDMLCLALFSLMAMEFAHGHWGY
ncbi:MAG: hypothetical protein ACSHXK_11405 [Oceanococcus sp.]